MSKNLGAKYTLISVVGPHAGESEAGIFERKIKDVENIGKTFWIIKSFQANFEKIKILCEKAELEQKQVYCFFIKPSAKGGAVMTKNAQEAKFYSEDKVNWQSLFAGLTPITGKIDSNTYALLFDELKLIDNEIDLWQYADFFNPTESIKIFRGGSSVCAVNRGQPFQQGRIKSRLRKVVAIARLVNPYCVWLKQ